MTELRVLHVFKYFRPAFTGEGVFVERLAPFMRRLSPNVTHEVLVTATPRPPDSVTVPGIAKIHYLSGLDCPSTQAGLVAWLARHASRYDVVHHHTHVDRTFAGALALKGWGRRVILSATLDDSIPGLLRTYRGVLRPVVRRLFRLIDCFVTISSKLQAENERFADGRSVLIPMGIPLPQGDRPDRASARRDLVLPPDAQVMVSVGGLCARKDQLFLVRELTSVLEADRRRRLILVGPAVEPDYEAQLRAEIAGRGLQDQVLLAGYSEPWAFYAAADLFVFASREEGFGTVAVEAMAHALPVIARRLPGVNDDFVTPGVTGRLFDCGEELQAAVEQLLADAGLRRRMGEEARAAAARFDIAETAARYLELYAPGEAPGRC